MPAVAILAPGWKGRANSYFDLTDQGTDVLVRTVVIDGKGGTILLIDDPFTDSVRKCEGFILPVPEVQ